MAEPINVEFDTICKNKGKIIDLVSGCAGASWFSIELQQEKFIDDGSIVHTLGLSEKDKVHRMMDSVESKIKYDSKCFDKFIRILKSSTSLQKLAGELVADCGHYKPVPMADDPRHNPPHDSNSPRLHLPSYMPAPTMHAVDDYAESLRSYYQKPKASTSYVHLAVVGKKEVSTQEMNAFTKITLHGNHDVIRVKPEPLDFSTVGVKQDGSLARFVFVEEAPGIAHGKTMFAWDVSRRWASGEILNQYRLVVLLKLCDERVQEAKSIYDLLYYPNHEIRAEVAKEIARINGKSVLLIFECYDELPRKLQTQRSIFLEILDRECLPEATVLITSRPSATEFLHNKFREQISQHIQILLQGHNYAIVEIRLHSPALVLNLKEGLLQQFDLKTFVDDLGRVGGFVRVAYNGATAAGPEFAELQVEIQKIGFEVADLCDASAITVAKFQDASGSILDDFQATYEYLMANETDMALGLFKGIQEVAGEMRKAAEVLQKRFEDEKNKVEDGVMYTLTNRGAMESKSETALYQTEAGLKSLSIVMREAVMFWRYMEYYCKELSQAKVERIIKVLQKKKSVKEQVKIVTSQRCKQSVMQFNARWVALNILCSEYKDDINRTQRELYSYMCEWPTYDQAKMDIGDLAKTILAGVEIAQEDLAKKRKASDDERKALHVDGLPSSNFQSCCCT